jgi:membrane fusion protein, multidrug efflux system
VVVGVRIRVNVNMKVHMCYGACTFAKTWSFRRWIVASSLLVVFGCLISGCGQQQAQQGQPQGKEGRQARPAAQGVPVMVDRVTLKTVPIEVTAIGNVEAYSTVSVRAQVSGPLMEARFEQGDFVHKGQVLFKIDERPYQTELEKAQAALDRDKAGAVTGRIQAERYKKLLGEGIVPPQQVESLVSAADASDAVVRSDEAAVKAAQLNLEYCTITAPIDGRSGTVMIQPGNLVKASDVAMVVINQINPIYVNFTVPQSYLPTLKKNMAKGKLRVMVAVPDDEGPPEQGVLVFVDNSIEASTGTIRLRAAFQNTRDRLWPGLFVSTVLRLSEQPDTTVVPASAITTGPDGQLVYVVKPDRTVEGRQVVTSRSIGGAAVIDKGLQAGETVVIDGQLRLVPGAKVDIKNSLTETAGAPGSKAADRKEVLQETQR